MHKSFTCTTILVVTFLFVSCGDDDNSPNIADFNTITVDLGNTESSFNQIIAEGIFTGSGISRFIINGSTGSGDQICLEIYNGGEMIEPASFPVTEPTQGAQTTVQIRTNGQNRLASNGTITIESIEQDVLIGNFNVDVSPDNANAEGLFNLPFNQTTTREATTDCNGSF